MGVQISSKDEWEGQNGQNRCVSHSSYLGVHIPFATSELLHTNKG